VVAVGVVEEVVLGVVVVVVVVVVARAAWKFFKELIVLVCMDLIHAVTLSTCPCCVLVILSWSLVISD